MTYFFILPVKKRKKRGKRERESGNKDGREEVDRTKTIKSRSFFLPPLVLSSLAFLFLFFFFFFFEPDKTMPALAQTARSAFATQ